MWNKLMALFQSDGTAMSSYKKLKRDLSKDGFAVTGQKAYQLTKEMQEVFSKPVTAKGFYINEPHGKLIYSGEETLIVKPRPFNVLNRQYVLVSGKQAYGVIKFTKMTEIDTNRFNELEFLHRITESERKSMWPGYDRFYAFEFVFVPYPEPIDVEVPDGTKNFLKEVRVRAEFIHDIKTFNPSTVDTKELIRDWSLVVAWYSNYMSSKGKGVPSSIKSNEQLEDLAFLIYKELRNRGIEFHPHTYTKYGKELWDKVVLRAETGLVKRSLAVINHGHYHDFDRPIFLQDILHGITQFKTKSPWVYLVGGIVNHGYTYGDVDILIRGPRDKALEFRIARMFPPNIARRIHFLYDHENMGPFTNYIPLLDQMASVNELTVKEMGFKRIPAPFAYFGGKRRQSTWLRQFIPKHRIYVEPFAGSAALFFAKKPAEIEVLNDKNRDIYETFTLLRDSTPEQRRWLRTTFPLRLSKVQLKAFLKKWNENPPRTQLGRVARFIVLTGQSFVNVPAPDIGKKVSFKTADKVGLVFLKHLEDYKDRLSNTRIYCQDWKKVVEKYDSKDTFFFIDPPYAADKRDRAYVGEKYGTMSYEEIISVLKRIKGKFMLTHDAPSLRKRLVDAGFHGYKIKFVHIASIGGSYKRKNPFNEYVITNFPMKKCEDYSFDLADLARVIASAREDAEASKSQDRLIPGRFFYQLKGLMGYRENEVYNIRSLVSILDEKNKYPYEIDKKYDGFRVQIHKQGSMLKIISEGGSDYTSRFPSIASQASKIGNVDFIVEGEIEGWESGYEKGKHFGRSDVAGYANARGPVSDKDFYLTIYDVLFWGDDLHKLPRSERVKYIENIKKSLGSEHANIRTVEYRVAKDGKEVESAVSYVRKLPASEGAMIKEWSSDYPLTGMSNTWLKFKNEADIDVIVIGRDKVKDQEAWNYYCAIFDSSDNIVPVGVTYNTKIKVPLGKILRVAFVNLNKYTDTGTGKVWYNWWSPRPIEYREDKDRPDNTLRADIIVKDTHGEVSDKPIKPKLMEAVKAYEKNQPIDMECSDPFLMQPYKPKTRFVLQAHIRGRSIHLDNRRQIDEDYLVGMTHFLPLSLSREPTSFEDAKKLYYDEIHDTVKKWMSTPEKKLQSDPKAIQPIDWLKVEGEREEGDIGATKEHKGYFIIIDEGELEWMAAKPDFHEYWYHGNLLKGKYVDRIIEGKSDGLVWEFFYTKNPPYVICPRSISKKYNTPYGVSQLPEKVTAKVPPMFQYWNVKDDSKRFFVRKNLVEAITAHKVKLSYQGKKIPFKLQHQTWKGPMVIRVSPTREEYRIILNLRDNLYYGIETISDPREGATTGQFKSYSKDFWTASGSIKPKTTVNDTKETPSNVEVLDEGTATILVWSPEFKRIVFKGKSMKGTWQAINKGDNLWVLSRFNLMSMELTISNAKLDKNTDYMTISGPCLIKTVAKGIPLHEDALKKVVLDPEYANRKLAYINWQHKRDEWNKVGILTKVWWSNRDKQVWFEGVITDRSAISLIADRYNSGRKLNVSAEIQWERESPEDPIESLRITGLALTDNPAIPQAGLAKVCDTERCVTIPCSKLPEGVPSNVKPCSDD